MTEHNGTEVDLVVVGSGTGLAAALSGRDAGLDVLVIEKTDKVGGSMARSGGAFWIPANDVLGRSGSHDTVERGEEYLTAVVGDAAPRDRWEAFLEHGDETVRLLARTTPLEFFWARGYADYHAELPGGDALGRTCESRPFDAALLGPDRARLRSGVVEASLPMPVTGADYKWMNLIARKPLRGLPLAVGRLAQGLYGKARGRDYTAGGQALAAGMFAGARAAGIPVVTGTALVDIELDGDRAVAAIVERDGRRERIAVRRGIVLAAGGFDHDLDRRHRYQSERLGAWSLGSEGNTGDVLTLGERLGADTALLDQAWWFPAVAPLPGHAPQVLLAERSLPGSLIVDQNGRRFINESTDYMTFGQTLLRRERDGDPVESMWLVFDQKYRNSYVLAGGIFPRQPLPQAWYDAGIAHTADTPAELAAAMGVDPAALTGTVERLNGQAYAGIDGDFHRGDSAYDRYYGDPTNSPNPNLRALTGRLYAVQVVLSDLGTCGGLMTDASARVLRADGTAFEGLYAIGNVAANVFGRSYPGAGATIGQGLVFGHIAARHAARSARAVTAS